MKISRTSMLLAILALFGLLAVACAPAATPQPAATAPAAQAPATTAPAGPKPKMTVWLSTSYTPLADETQKKFILEWAAAKGVDVTIVQDSSTVLAPQLNAAIESKTCPTSCPGPRPTGRQS